MVVSSTEVVLSWHPPHNVAPDDVKAYTVHYAASDSGEEFQEVSIAQSHRLRGLKASTAYWFYVRAYIRKAASDPSERLFFTTADEAVSSHTANGTGSLLPNVTLVPLSPTTLKVAWRRPTSPADTGRPVALYKIQYRRHRAKEFDIEVVRGRCSRSDNSSF